MSVVVKAGGPTRFTRKLLGWSGFEHKFRSTAGLIDLTEGALWNLLTWHRTLDTAHYRTHRKTSQFGLRIEYHRALVLRFPQKTLIFSNGTRASLKLPDKVQPEMSCNGVSIGAGVDS